MSKSDNKLIDIVTSIEEIGNVAYVEGATEEQITAFETENGIHLPGQFREWLRFSDGGELFLPAGIQLYGVAHKPVIDVDDPDRPDENYIVIGALSFGDPIVCEKNGDKVAIYNHEAGRIEDDEIYPDFYSFICDLKNILGVEG